MELTTCVTSMKLSTFTTVNLLPPAERNMKLLSLFRCVPATLLLLWSTSVSSFQLDLRSSKSLGYGSSTSRTNSVNDDDRTEEGRPTFPPSSFAWHSAPSVDDDANDYASNDPPQKEHQANTRFSKFAPDINLEASDFRAQLRENMKADLERRRNEDPNRGNQISKNYLDNL